MGTTNFDTVHLDAVMNAVNFQLSGTAVDFKKGTTQITGANATISHGLTTLGKLYACPAGTTATLINRCSAVQVNGAVVRRYKATSAATTTLIASTATSSVHWIAIGKA